MWYASHAQRPFAGRHVDRVGARWAKGTRPLAVAVGWLPISCVIPIVATATESLFAALAGIELTHTIFFIWYFINIFSLDEFRCNK